METVNTPLDVTATASPRPGLAGAARKNHQLVRFLVLADFVVVTLAALLAAVLSSDHESVAELGVWIPSTVLVTLAAFSFYRLYERDRSQIVVSTLDEWRDFLNALSVVGLLQLTVGLALGLHAVVPVGASTVAIFWVTALLLLPLVRATFRRGVFRLLNTEQATLIVGAGNVGQMIALKILKHREYNLQIVGFLDDEPHELDDRLAEIPVLGGENDLVETIREHNVSRVVLAFSRHPVDQLLELIRSAGLQDIHLSIVPRYFEIMAANVGIVDVEGIPVVEVPAPRLSRAARASKRGLDLVDHDPRTDRPRAVLPVRRARDQARLARAGLLPSAAHGRGHEIFEIIKFRTMVDGRRGRAKPARPLNEIDGTRCSRSAHDPRVTRVGRVCARCSLDELPQLLNVLKGEMSLVGPRPFVVHEDEKIDGWARRRLDLTPGMTGCGRCSAATTSRSRRWSSSTIST